MSTTEFLDRLVKRIDRLDRKHLEDYVLDLVRGKKLLTTLLDHIPEGVAAFNDTGHIVFSNRRFVQLLNLPEHYFSAHVHELLEDPQLRSLVTKALKTKEELFQKELEVLSPRPMILQITLMHDRSEKSELKILILRNITQSELSTREQFQIQNLESLVGLAAGIAHEIGNPINSMGIHLQLVTKALKQLPLKESKKIEPSVQVIREEMERLDKIIRNFLGAVRRKPLRFEPAKIHDLLSKTIAFLEPELKAARIRIIQERDDRLTDFLMDPERIYQVFLNIVKNAIYAMPNGGTLIIRTQLKGKLCLIQFQDTGIGITEEHLPKIFDAYYTTKEAGSGLGLMIVYQIIREHGGQIEVASKPHEGTRFTLILPVRKEKLGLPEPARGKK